MRYTHFIFILFTSLFYGQQNELVDFKRIHATVTPIIDESKVEGKYTVQFKMLQTSDSVYLDAKNMKITYLPEDGPQVYTSKDKIWLKDTFEKDKTYTVLFNYEARPKQALYFIKDQIWTQGQGKYTSHWLPSIDGMNDKIEFDLNIVAPANKKVIANGDLEKFIIYEDNIIWQYNMDHPMPSYLVAFAIGDFKMKKMESQSGIPIELYLASKDTLKREPTYRYTKEIFDFLESEIDVPYPWQNYKQVPVRDFLYAGMENTGCTLFSEAFVVDAIGFNDRNYVNINAHELAHQWFGNLVTETESTHHWLHEGFATYYALLAERELFGEDYYYWKLYNSAEQLKELSDQGKGESLLNPKASSLTYYEKGAWALHILKELIGKEAFNRAVKNYLSNNAYGNVTTAHFVNEVKAVTTISIETWEKDWLQQSAFKGEQAYNSLKKSLFMQGFFQLSALRASPIEEKQVLLKDAILSKNDFIGQEAVYQLANEDFEKVADLYELALASNNLFIRQAVALSLERIPDTFQKSMESLLEDKSYLTKENALSLLWVNFPEKRKVYLDQTSEVIGFQDKNVRQLWLALAIHTEDFSTYEKSLFYSELLNYSGDDYSFEIREKALEYLFFIGVTNDTFIKNLVNASTHHYWRFRDKAREILKEFMKDEANNEKVVKLYNSFSEKEKTYIQRKLRM